MSTTTGVYGQFVEQLAGGKIDLATDVFVVVLLSNLYTPSDLDTWPAILQYEISGAGYASTGNQLRNVRASYSSATNTFTFTADDTVWTDATITCAYAVILDVTAKEALVSYVDFGGNLSVSNGTLSIGWNSLGIVSIAN